MKILRSVILGALIMSLLLILAFPAAGAKLPVPNVFYGKATDGIIDTESLYQTLPNGVTQTFTLPSNKTLIFNSVFANFTPDSPPSGLLYLAIITRTDPFNYYFRWALSGPNAAGRFYINENISPGIGVSVIPIIRVEDENKNPVSGTLTVRFFGIIQ